jgi:hypothetical protein
VSAAAVVVFEIVRPNAGGVLGVMDPGISQAGTRIAIVVGL